MEMRVKLAFQLYDLLSSLSCCSVLYCSYINMSCLVVQIGAAGVVPSLVDLLRDESAEAHDSGVGALANLAACPRNRELIADAGGIEPLLKLLNETGTDANIVDMAVGTLGNLAALAANQALLIPTNMSLRFSLPPLGALNFSSKQIPLQTVLYSAAETLRCDEAIAYFLHSLVCHQLG